MTRDDPHAWLDKYITAQRAMHGDTVADMIREAACAAELYGEDVLEQFTRDLKTYHQHEPLRSGRWRAQRALERASNLFTDYDGHDVLRDTIDGVPIQDIVDNQCSTRRTSMHNQSLYLPIMDGNIAIVEVAFRPNDEKLYTYKAESSHALAVGDTVIVEARDWYAIATVKRVGMVIPMDDVSTTFRWIVGKLDIAEHKALLEYEQQVIAQVNTKRAEAMREKMLDALGITREQATLILDHTNAEVKGDA